MKNNIFDLYNNCRLCPRSCGVDRNKGAAGFCRGDKTTLVAYAGLHKGEEPPVAGERGSGTVFFSGCTLQCPFCQNYQISRERLGSPVSVEELSGIFLKLQDAGAENINMVSGTHFIPGILEALDQSRNEGLILPVVWNSSGYDSLESLDLLLPYVDIFLPDIKSLDQRITAEIFRTPDYPEVIKKGLLFLKEMVPPIYTPLGMERGIILRHMVLPGEIESSLQVLNWFRENLYGSALISLMFQYTPPVGEKNGTAHIPPLTRNVSQGEYFRVMEHLEKLGIEEGFIQELNPEDATWSPDFRKLNPFSSEFSRPVWSNGIFVEPERFN